MTGPYEDRADEAAIEAWCRDASAGDADALERLLWAYHGRLSAFTRRKIGTDWQGRIDPDDVLQEAYFDVFRGISEFTYDGEDSFYRWATRIIDHRFIDQVRSLRRRKRDAAREVRPAAETLSRHESFLDRCLADTTTASRILRRADAVSALMTCIAKLPDDYRVVVQRFYLNEEPLAAVAADLGRSEDAVRRLGTRAVQRLSACLRRALRFLSSHD